MSVFKKEEKAEVSQEKTAPTPKPRSKRKTATTRSTQVVLNQRSTPARTSNTVFFNASNSPAPVAYDFPRTLTAAAVQVKMNDKGEFEQFKARRSASSSAWQAEAWEYYDAIGEIKYAFNLVASVVSRIRVFAS